MSLWRIAWKNMRQRGVASSLTVLSMALGVAVMVGVIVVHAVAVKQFGGDAQGYHLIIGGKGGDLQLVLSTVYHLGESRYTLPYSLYQDFLDGEYAELTEVAVPYCLGDSFDPPAEAGEPSSDPFRVVATTSDLFDKIEYGTDSDGVPQKYTFREGRNFRNDRAYEAVLGSVVAARSGLAVGDTLNPTHGIGGNVHENQFKIVGVLDPTGTANDRAVFINMEGFYLIEDHQLSAAEGPQSGLPPAVLGAEASSRLKKSRGDQVELAGSEYEVIATLAKTNTGVDRQAFGPIAGVRLPEADRAAASVGVPTDLYDNEGNRLTPLPAPQREVTSILVLAKNVMGPTVLTTKINKDHNRSAQAVAPARVVTSLLEGIIGPLRLVLLVLTVLIIVVASISVLVSIYNSMNERSRDIAVMRALGASRLSVMAIVLGESVLLSIAGGGLGILLGHTLIAVAAPYLEAQAGIRLAFWEFDPWEVVVIPVLVGLATLAGLLPAFTAYRTDVAKSL